MRTGNYVFGNKNFILSLLSGWAIAWGLSVSIQFPLHSSKDIIGPLTLLQFNFINNIFRYLLFCATPSAVLFWLEKIKPSDHGMDNKEFCYPRVKQTQKYNKLFYILYIIIIILFLSTFLQYPKTDPLDIFHEGEMLTPAINFLHGRGIYKGSFFIHGAFYDCLTAILSWNFFEVQTIGALRELLRFLYAFSGICLAFFIISLCFFLRKTGHQGIAFIYVCCVIILIISTYQILYTINRRDACVFIGASVVFTAYRYIMDRTYLEKLTRLFVLGVFAGMLCLVQIFYTIDRGAYLFLFLFCSCAYLFLLCKTDIKKKALIFSCGVLFGTILSALVFYIILGKDEISSFWENFYFFSTSKDLFDSYVYTFSLRRAFPILTISIAITLCVQNFFSNRKFSQNQTILFLTTTLAFFYYRSALGRSDSSHIMYASFFSTLIIIPIYFECVERIPFKFSYAKKYCTAGLIMIIFILVIPTIRKNIAAELRELLTLQTRLQIDDDLIYRQDRSFLTNDDKETYTVLRALVNESQQKSFQDLSSGVGWNYLLDLPSTSKFHLPWFAMKKEFQSRLVGDLASSMCTYITAYSSDWWSSIDGIPNEFRLPYLFRFLHMNYSFFRKVGKIEIFRARKTTISNDDIKKVAFTSPNQEGNGQIVHFSFPAKLYNKGCEISGYIEINDNSELPIILIIGNGKILSITGPHIFVEGDKLDKKSYSGWRGYINTNELNDGVHLLQAYTVTKMKTEKINKDFLVTIFDGKFVSGKILQ